MELFAIEFNPRHFSGAGLLFVMGFAIIGGLIGLCLRERKEVRKARSVHHRAMVVVIELYPEISRLFGLKDRVHKAIQALLISVDRAEERHSLDRAMRDTDLLAAEIGKKYAGVLDLRTIRSQVNEATMAWFEGRTGEANAAIAAVLERFDAAIASVVECDHSTSRFLTIARTAERVIAVFQTRSSDGDKEWGEARHELDVASDELDYALSS
jgi:hypothetical protein